ncbi:MAG TPA: energy transducer TonB [Blastocatellia bacterium]|nr:energy transducer TonB [Blastocatellia bacterium]
MKKVILIILPLIVFAVSINAQPSRSVPAKTQWQEFRSEKENFKVMLPSQPREGTEIVESEIGRVPIRSFASHQDANFFTVMVAEYPLSFDTEEAAKDVLEAGIGAMTAKMKLENIEQKDIVLGNYRGRELKAQFFSGVLMVRAVVVKNRMYMLLTAVDKVSLKSPTPAEVKQFFDSFSFIKSPESIAITAAPVSGIEAEKDEAPADYRTQPIAWREFRKAEYGFAVRLPRDPKKETIKINPNDPRLDMHNWIAIGERGLVYQVAFQQLLAVPENEYSANAYIESLRDGLAQGIGGKIVSERQVTYNGHPGREFKIKSAKIDGLGRLFLVGSRVYILNILTAIGEVNQKAANDYFDSLVVTVTPNTVSTTAGTVLKTATWREVAEPKLGFTVMMPAEPSRETKNVVDLKIELLSATGDGVLCVAGHMFVPGPLPTKKDLAQFFKSFGGGFASSMKASVVSEKEISLEGNPGRELTLKNDYVTGLCRIYMVKGHAYMLIALPTLSNDADTAMAKFLNSIKLTERNGGQDAPPPPPPPMPVREGDGSQQPAPKKINVSGGVLQGSALKRVQPAYPLEAKMVRAQGEVRVQILVSEEGKVVEAIVLDGPEELRQVALDAARKWEFKRTELSGVPVKVQGVLTFRFTLQ